MISAPYDTRKPQTPYQDGLVATLHGSPAPPHMEGDTFINPGWKPPNADPGGGYQTFNAPGLEPDGGRRRFDGDTGDWRDAAEPGGIAGPAAGGYVPPNGNTGVTGGIPAPQAPPTYAPIQGFDFGKLSGTTPYDSPDKYSDAVRAFSAALGGGTQISRNNLQPMVDAVRAKFPNARVVGDDKIDFGDGKGPIDVIMSNGQIWFQNGQDRFGDAGGPGAGAGLPAGSDPGVGGSFLSALMRLLNPQQASLADPDLASQSQANKVAQQRSYERRRAATAEQSAAGGQMGGALEAGIDTALSARGDAEGAFDADLLARKNDQNRQSQLAALGPALNLFGLNQNNSQFLQRLGLDQGIANGQLNLQSLLALLNGL